MDAEDRERVLQILRANRESVTEHGIVRRDGTRSTVEAWAAGRGRGGAVHGDSRHLGSKRAKDALREERGTTSGVGGYDVTGRMHQSADGTIIDMNPAAELDLGKTREEFLGSSSGKEELGTVREDGTPFPGKMNIRRWWLCVPGNRSRRGDGSVQPTPERTPLD